MAGSIEKGKKIGPYEVVGPLGQGGMASVYRVYQPSLDREVAIKLMAQQYASDPTFVERFRREARSIARLRHPNILTVYDAGEDEGLLYIVMELIEGATLKEELHGQPMAVDKALGFINQVAGALDYANKSGIVHRDIKPSNVLIDNASGRAVLSDFGIAKLAEQSNQLTSTGTGVGTPDYMSPEQAMGEDIDSRSDQYSLAVMLYELLTGRTPYSGDTPIAVVMGHISKPLPSARLLNPQIPATVEAVLNKALSKKKEDRYESAGAFNEALQEAWRNHNSVGAAAVATASEPTQLINSGAVRPGSGPFIPEAEQLYDEARRQEQLNNFEGAFRTFSQLDSRFPRYRDVPTLLERYRSVGYGQNQANNWQNAQNRPDTSGQYGGATVGQAYNRPPSGQYGAPVSQQPYNAQPSGQYTPAAYTGSTGPVRAKSSFPLLPVIGGIVLLAIAAIIAIVVAGSGGNRSVTPTAQAAANVTAANNVGAATAAPPPALNTPTAPPAVATATQPPAATTQAAALTTRPAQPTNTPRPAQPTNTALPTIARPPTAQAVVPTAPPAANTPASNPGTLKYVTYREPGGLWTVEVPDNWEADKDSNGITFKPKDDPTVAMGVITEEIGSNPSQATVDELLKAFLESSGAKIDKQEKRKVDGQDITYSTGTFNQSGITLNLKLATVLKGTKVHLIIYFTLPGRTAQTDPIFDRFLNTIKFS